MKDKSILTPISAEIRGNNLNIKIPLSTLVNVCHEMGYELDDYDKLIDKLIDDRDQDTGRSKIEKLIEDCFEELADDGELKTT